MGKLGKKKLMPIQKTKLDTNGLGPGVNIHYESEYIAKRQQLVSYYKSLRDDSDYESEDELFNELKQKCKISKDRCKIRYQMVTINFKTFSKYLVDLFEEKILTKKCLRKWVGYTFQFGEDGQNPHVHLIVKKQIQKSHVIREIFSTLRGAHVESKECIDVKDKPDKYLENGIKYLQKIKDKDEQMRAKYKLESWYLSNGDYEFEHPDDTPSEMDIPKDDSDDENL